MWLEKTVVFFCIYHLLTLWSEIDGHQLDCESFDCNDLRCETIYCPKDYVLTPKISDPCRCCSGCVKYKKLNEACDYDATTDLTKQNVCSNLYESELCNPKENLICEYGICVLSTDQQSQPCVARLSEYLDKDRYSDWFWNANCTADGKYEAKQCKGNKCFCSASDGERIFGTFTLSQAHLMNCECSLMEKKLSENAQISGQFDHVYCQKSGNYQPLQCIQDMCFCTNETNGNVIGIIVPKTLVHFLPCYEATTFAQYFNAPCQRQRENEEKLTSYYFKKGMNFEYLDPAKCNPDGTYVAKQCESDRCYCSHPDTGKQLGNQAIPVLSPEANKMNCYCLIDRLEVITDGGLQSQDCDKNGNFRPVACYGNTCYCQDRDGYRDSTEVDMRPWAGKFCEIDDERVRTCYTSAVDIDCSSILPYYLLHSTSNN